MILLGFSIPTCFT